MRLTAEDGSTVTEVSMVVTWLVMAVAASSCSVGVCPAVRAGKTWGVIESKTASGSSVAFASGMSAVSDVAMSSMAVAVSSARVPAPTVVRSTSVGSLAAMTEKAVAETQRGDRSALAREARRSLIVVPRAAVAKRVRDEEGRSRAMIAVIAVRACSASSSSPPEAFHDRIEEMSACWARMRAPVPFVEVSPVAGLTLTRAMEVKVTSSVGVRAEAGAIVIWSAEAIVRQECRAEGRVGGPCDVAQDRGARVWRGVVVPLCPDGGDDVRGWGRRGAGGPWRSRRVTRGRGGRGGVEGAGEDVGATQPASRRDEGKAAIERGGAGPRSPCCPTGRGPRGRRRPRAVQ